MENCRKCANNAPNFVCHCQDGVQAFNKFSF
jgi:hypothetical protein